MAIRFDFRLLLLLLLLLVPAARGQADPSSADVSAALSTTNVHAGDKVWLSVVVNVHEGLHAQSHTPVDEYAIKFELTPKKNELASFGDVQYPPGIDRTFPNLGKLNVYLGKTVFLVPVEIKTDAKPGPLTLAGSVFFQACNDDACFPPEKIKYSVDTAVVGGDVAVTPNPAFDGTIPKHITAPATGPTTAPAAIAPSTGGSTDGGTKILGIDLDHGAWPVAFVAAFFIGILFNLMPCVLPVLPLKIMGFYEVSQHDRKKSILLGAVFSAGLIASFGVLAALVVGSTQLQWGALFEHAWFTATISIVLVAMAISTFGFFTVNVPTALYSFTPRHDTYVGNFLFGVLTAALSTPCTFGMFVGLLAWALKQPAWVGGSSIVMVGVGMASPYFLLSAIPEVARNLPRTGPWAEVVKQMMGFLLLATAVFFARPFYQHLLSDDFFYWSLFAVLAAAGVFLIVRSVQLSHRLGSRLIATGIAIAIIAPTFYTVRRLTEKPYIWKPYSYSARVSANESGKPVLVDFTATWCTNCHYLEAFVLHDPRVVRAVRDLNVVMLQADMTDVDHAPDKPLLRKLNGAGNIPLTAVYFPHQDQPRVLKGIYTADDLVKTLTQ
jgi:thiol:disulfide interchange protein DsbD